jgi:transposase
LYPGASRTLRDCIDPHHLLIRIDTTLDLASLAEPLQVAYRRDGRPAIAPEIVLRALLLGAIYQVPSHRQLCERIGENLAWRWFCHLTLDDPVFDHSTLSVFLERVGHEALTAVLDRLNEALAAADLLSPRTYLDSSLVPAAVSRADLAPRDETDPPPEQEPEEGIWQTRTQTPGSETDPPQIRMLRYQDARGRLTLSPTDRDARWRTHGDRSILGYKEHVLADRSGFILGRRATGADVADSVAALPLLQALRLPISSLAADSGYRAGAFRRVLERREITAYIPLGSNQDAGLPAGFTDQGDHLTCPVGKRLRLAGFPDADGRVRFRAQAADCRICPQRTNCVTPSRAAKAVWTSIHRFSLRRAAQANTSVRFTREQRRRQTVSEGVFAHLDRLGGTRAHFRGLDRVECHGALCALAHNILKALTKVRFWPREAAVLPHPATRLRPFCSIGTPCT